MHLQHDTLITSKERYLKLFGQEIDILKIQTVELDSQGNIERVIIFEKDDDKDEGRFSVIDKDGYKAAKSFSTRRPGSLEINKSISLTELGFRKGYM